jgi:hypothetical protein
VLHEQAVQYDHIELEADDALLFGHQPGKGFQLLFHDQNKRGYELMFPDGNR